MTILYKKLIIKYTIFMINYLFNNSSMYFVIIEPMYSQGVGNYVLLTDNVKNIDKFRLQLFNYKNYIKTACNDDNDLDLWEFYEYVYKITNITNIKKTNIYEGITLLEKSHNGDYNFVECNYEQNNQKKSEVIYEDDKKLKLNYVYNNIDSSKKPCIIDAFDILC